MLVLNNFLVVKSPASGQKSVLDMSTDCIIHSDNQSSKKSTIRDDSMHIRHPFSWYLVLVSMVNIDGSEVRLTDATTSPSLCFGAILTPLTRLAVVQLDQMSG